MGWIVICLGPANMPKLNNILGLILFAIPAKNHQNKEVFCTVWYCVTACPKFFARQRCSRSQFRWLTGNEVSELLFSPLFSSSSTSTFSSLSQPFLTEWLLDQKTYLMKVDGSAQKLRGSPPFKGHFGTTIWPFWIFEILIKGMIESKNLFCESLITKGLTYFRTL